PPPPGPGPGWRGPWPRRRPDTDRETEPGAPRPADAGTRAPPLRVFRGRSPRRALRATRRAWRAPSRRRGSAPRREAATPSPLLRGWSLAACVASYLQRQGDRALLVRAQNARRKTGGQPAR